MKMKQTGSVWDNHGLWYYSVKLPGEKTRRNVPLKASNSNHFTFLLCFFDAVGDELSIVSRKGD